MFEIIDSNFFNIIENLSHDWHQTKMNVELLTIVFLKFFAMSYNLNEYAYQITTKP